MRLSDWRATAQGRKVMTANVAAAFEPALAVLGAPPNPTAHVAWGDDPGTRYTILAACDAGLIIANVRVNVPQEGPRASARLIRWSRVQVGESSVEAHHGHRYLTTQMEGHILQGVDDIADRIGAWLAYVLARIDGRPPDLVTSPGPRAARPPKPAAAPRSPRPPRRPAPARAPKKNVRSMNTVVPFGDAATDDTARA